MRGSSGWGASAAGSQPTVACHSSGRCASDGIPGKSHKMHYQPRVVHPSLGQTRLSTRAGQSMKVAPTSNAGLEQLMKSFGVGMAIAGKLTPLPSSDASNAVAGASRAVWEIAAPHTHLDVGGTSSTLPGGVTALLFAAFT
eukprot:1918559-Prymnesium_polylepis.1